MPKLYGEKVAIFSLPVRMKAQACFILLLFILAFAFSSGAQNVTMELKPRWPWNGVDITFTNHDDTPVILSGFQGYAKTTIKHLNFIPFHTTAKGLP